MPPPLWFFYNKIRWDYQPGLRSERFYHWSCWVDVRDRPAERDSNPGISAIWFLCNCENIHCIYTGLGIRCTVVSKEAVQTYILNSCFLSPYFIKIVNKIKICLHYYNFGQKWIWPECSICRGTWNLILIILAVAAPPPPLQPGQIKLTKKTIIITCDGFSKYVAHAWRK